MVEESGDEVEAGDMERVRNSKRECPVPKPPGIIGEILGFKSSSTPLSKSSTPTSRPVESSSSEGKGSRPP